MPREDRRIIFESSEVYKAIFTLCRKKQLDEPPPGHIVKTYTPPNDSNSVFIDIENPQEQMKTTLQYTSDFVAAALMHYCRGNRIPLPRTSQKSVMVIDSELVLRVQVARD